MAGWQSVIKFMEGNIGLLEAVRKCVFGLLPWIFSPSFSLTVLFRMPISIHYLRLMAVDVSVHLVQSARYARTCVSFWKMNNNYGNA